MAENRSYFLWFGTMQTIKLINFSYFQPKIVISANCGVEPNRNVLYKPMLDEGLEIATHKPKHCIIYNRPMVKSSHFYLTTTI